MDKGRLGEVKYQAQSPSSCHTNFWTQKWVEIWLWEWGHYLCVLFSLHFIAVEGIIAVPVELRVGKSCCLPSFRKTGTLPGLASSWLSCRECWPPWLQESLGKLHAKTIASCSAPTVRGQFHFSWPELQGPWAPCDAVSQFVSVSLYNLKPRSDISFTFLWVVGKYLFFCRCWSRVLGKFSASMARRDLIFHRWGNRGPEK